MRSSTAHTRFRQLASPGSRPITFTRQAGLAEGAFDEVRVPDSAAVLDWERF